MKTTLIGAVLGAAIAFPAFAQDVADVVVRPDGGALAAAAACQVVCHARAPADVDGASRSGVPLHA
ncbi:MAG: hypothetical protein ABGW82_08770, partial [Paracoccus sp. (in: a-proteobacteria)]